MLIIPANSLASGGFAVDNSCRFDDGSSASMSRDQSANSAGTTTIGTLSVWIKMSAAGTEQVIYERQTDTSNYFKVWFENNKLLIQTVTGGSIAMKYETNRLFRDPSAWYHIVVVLDSTDGSAGDRQQIWINGVKETSFSTSTNIGSSASFQINTGTGTDYIGKRSSGNYFDGYIAEFAWIDGTDYTTTSFGEFDADSGAWKAIDVSGLTFGTNGFYLDFEDSAALGNDANGGTDFTVNNLTSIDQSTDTPTNNFATMNALGGYGTFSEGNLKFVTSTTDGQWGTSTISLSSGGKWYCEVKMIATSDKYQVGLTNNNAQEFTYRVVYRSDGVIYVGGSSTSGYTTYTTNDIIGMAFDSLNREITFYKNGSSVGTVTAPALASSVPQDYFFGATSLSSGTLTTEWNFGNPPYSISSGNADGNGYGNFEYSVPSGYYSLNTKNLAEFG